MVLRVARIIQPTPDQQALAKGAQKPQLQLTDGWYAVRAIVDAPMAGLIQTRQICVGKILENGALECLLLIYLLSWMKAQFLVKALWKVTP